MNPIDEYLFTVDENNNPIQPQPRSFAHSSGIWHRTTAIWILNKSKQILCQQRSLTKDVNPGMWEACFGRHVGQNEDTQDNATQELRQELGIPIVRKELKYYKVFKNDKPTHKTFVYVFGAIIDNQTFNLQNEEIDHVEWRDLPEVVAILSDNSKPEWVKKASDNEVLRWLNDLIL